MMSGRVLRGRRRGLRSCRHSAYRKQQGPGQQGSYCRNSMDCSHQLVHFPACTGFSAKDIYKDSKRNLWLRVRFPATTRTNGTQSNTATSPHREWFAHSLRCEFLHPLAVLTEPESSLPLAVPASTKNAATHDVLPCVEKGIKRTHRRLASPCDLSTSRPVSVKSCSTSSLGWSVPLWRCTPPAAR
jgi:hypothetical protein